VGGCRRRMTLVVQHYRHSLKRTPRRPFAHHKMHTHTHTPFALLLQARFRTLVSTFPGIHHTSLVMHTKSNLPSSHFSFPFSVFRFCHCCYFEPILFIPLAEFSVFRFVSDSLDFPSLSLLSQLTYFYSDFSTCCFLA